MTSREAFERYMYGYIDTTPRTDVQKETRQHFKTWRAAWDASKKTEREECAMVVEKFKYWVDRQAKHEISEAIRLRHNGQGEPGVTK